MDVHLQTEHGQGRASSPASPPDAISALSRAQRPPDLRAAVEHLAESGAVFQVPGRPTADLVGDLRWHGDNAVFWFTAFGDAVRDAHLLEFDSLQPLPDRGVCFCRQGAVVGSMSTIDGARLEDPDDYRVAWRIWQQLAPLQSARIDDCWREMVGVAADGY